MNAHVGRAPPRVSGGRAPSGCRSAIRKGTAENGVPVSEPGILDQRESWFGGGVRGGGSRPRPGAPSAGAADGAVFRRCAIPL